ncbi:MAG: hypothetical protein ABII96_00925 [Candidatus Zixiibacteriota bacterium]
MKTKLMICLIFLVSGWVFLAVKGNSAEVKRKSDKVPISTLAPAPENNIPPRPPSKYPVNGIKYSGNCTDIAPEWGIEIEHSQIGTTWYDFQQNGSMGRMISVTSGGYRHGSWMYTNIAYTGGAGTRMVKGNCEPVAGGWIGASTVHDRGNAGYCNQTNLSDGTPIVIYHSPAATPTPTWYCAITADDEPCGSFWTRHWDIPDYITNSPSGQPGMWSRAEVGYDTATGRDYIHVVMTEGNTAGGVPVDGSV